MADPEFVVEKTESIALIADAVLKQRELMSPYVWRDAAGALHLLVRAVPHPWDDDRITGRIWHGFGEEDGLTFRMEEEPLIIPGPGEFDAMGCEDPTLVPTADGCVVYYTGLDADFDAQMLYAAGPDVLSLKKRGMVFKSFKTQDNTKEATVWITKDGAWRLFYEFARNDASLIGLALGEGPAGPWGEYSEPFAPRPKSWDSWHLSTGPMLYDDPERPLMFYNGASRDAVWRIGWVVFSRDCKEVLDRSVEPLITPPSGSGGRRDIAFAASLIAEEGRIWLYYSIHDRALFRALLRRR